MRRPLFHLVQNIVRSEKYFDTSRDEIERTLRAAGEYEITTELEVVDVDGSPVTAELRLNIATRSSIPQAWQLALKLHTIRIDGIDFEPRFKCQDGAVGRGWHRHLWDAALDSAEHKKVQAPQMDGVETREDFLLRAFGILRIRLNKVDHGEPRLQFD